MCDCYLHKCKKCDTELPIHLSDFFTARDEVDVFCSKHIPKENVDIFICKKKDWDINKEIWYPKGYKIGIRSLTKNAKKYREGNAPNLSNFAFLERF